MPHKRTGRREPCAWCGKQTEKKLEVQPFRWSPCCDPCGARLINRKPVKLGVRVMWDRDVA